MIHLGHTRSCHKPNHLLLTPDTFVRAPLPGMQNATAIVHASPALGAGFTQYTAELQPGGMLGATKLQRFVYVMEGAVEPAVGPGTFAFFPAGSTQAVTATAAARVLVIEKPYIALDDLAAPKFFSGDGSAIASQPLLGDPAIRVQPLLPDSPQFDFAVNLMTFDPGASLPMTEIHVMEHGLLMLQGGGIYRLGDCWHPVTAGDFIWMAPHCPQWFGALGKAPAQYIIYKDWNRHPQS